MKILLGLPGLDSKRVSNGLKIPPLLVLSTEREREAMELMDTIEKYGAVCVIEDTGALLHKDESLNEESAVHVKKEGNKMGWIFGVVIILVLISIIIIHYFTKDDEKYKIQMELQQTASVYRGSGNTPGNGLASMNGARGAQVSGNNSAKNDENSVASESKVIKNLKKELVKNPYNDSAWKILSENFEKEGDTAAARAAKESYEKAVKAQRILSGLAKAFGNDVRVEVRESAVYYRTSKELTDGEFYKEAAKLSKNLNSRFPGRNVVIENYTSKNEVQSVTIKAEQ